MLVMANSLSVFSLLLLVLLLVVVAGKLLHVNVPADAFSGAVNHYESLFHLEPYSAKEDLLSDQVVHAGPGNVKKHSSHHTTAIRWQVTGVNDTKLSSTKRVSPATRPSDNTSEYGQRNFGPTINKSLGKFPLKAGKVFKYHIPENTNTQVGCKGRVWKQHTDFVPRLRHQAQDGTLAEVVQQPIVGWHVKTEASDAHRERREVPVRPTRLVSLDPIQPSRVYGIDAAPSATPVFVTEVKPSVTPEYGSTQVTDPRPISNVTGSSTSSRPSTPSGEEEEVAITTPPLPRATTERVSPATRHIDETGGGGDDNYLVTFVVPAVVIVAMLALVSSAGCVLYRRRRRGNMSDDERPSFRNKGVLVIFQDEPGVPAALPPRGRRLRRDALPAPAAHPLLDDAPTSRRPPSCPATSRHCKSIQ